MNVMPSRFMVLAAVVATVTMQGCKPPNYPTGTIEQKYYAFGRRDGTWSYARSGVWRVIRYKEVNRQHGVLYSSYFCPDGSPIRSAKDAINRFKYGVPVGEPPRNSNKR